MLSITTVAGATVHPRVRQPWCAHAARSYPPSRGVEIPATAVDNDQWASRLGVPPTRWAGRPSYLRVSAVTRLSRCRPCTHHIDYDAAGPVHHQELVNNAASIAVVVTSSSAEMISSLRGAVTNDGMSSSLVLLSLASVIGAASGADDCGVCMCVPRHGAGRFSPCHAA